MLGPAEEAHPLLVVHDLVKWFPIYGGLRRRQVGAVRAVDGVSFHVARGETLGLVGESGCGKSTLARLLLRLETPTSGSATFRGANMFSDTASDMRALRRSVQMMFQDPYGSLNPRMSVGQIIEEPLVVNSKISRGERQERVRSLLGRVGLSPDDANKHPHQFSGGQRQRIGIARALALDPALIVCDEPVSALDVSVQAQIINLLEDIQRETGVAYIFVAHDLSVVRHISHRVAVMYLGQIVEIGDQVDIYERPTHPYTQALLSSIPSSDGDKRAQTSRIVLEGEIPSPADPPSGCRFRTRCWKARPRCAEEAPALVDRLGHGHPSACHYPELDERPMDQATMHQPMYGRLEEP